MAPEAGGGHIPDNLKPGGEDPTKHPMDEVAKAVKDEETAQDPGRAARNREYTSTARQPGTAQVPETVGGDEVDPVSLEVKDKNAERENALSGSTPESTASGALREPTPPEEESVAGLAKEPGEPGRPFLGDGEDDEGRKKDDES